MLSKLDLFGSPVRLSLNCSSVYRSQLGGIFSIGAAILILLSFSTNIISLVNQDKLKVASELSYDTNPFKIEFGVESLMFGLRIDQLNNDFLTRPYFNIVLLLGSITQTGLKQETKYTSLQLEPCTINHFAAYFQRNISNITEQEDLISKLICPKIDQRFVLDGSSSSSQFNFIKIEVKECIQSELDSYNPDWKATCADKDYLSLYKSSIGAYQVSVYLNNFIINPDKQQYAVPFLNSDLSFNFIPNETLKNIDIFLREYNIETQSNLLLNQSLENQKYIVQDYMDYKEKILSSGSNSFYCQLLIRRSPYTQYYSRHYSTITDFVGNLGGFIYFIMICIGAAAKKYNSFQFTQDLSNKLYSLKAPEVELSETAKEYHSFEIQQKSQVYEDENLKQGDEVEKSNITVLNKSQNKFFDVFENKLNSVKLFTSKILHLHPSSQQGFPSNSILKSVNNQVQEDFDEERLKSELYKAAKLNKSPRFIFGNKTQKVTNSIIESKVKQNQEIASKFLLQQEDYQIASFKKIISRTQIQIKAGISFFLRQITCKKLFDTPQNQIFEKANQFISQDLDLFLILNKLQEVDKLKKILFSKDQDILFSFFPKPEISIDSSSGDDPINEIRTLKEKLKDQVSSKQQGYNIKNKTNEYKAIKVSSHHPLFAQRRSFHHISSFEQLYHIYEKIRHNRTNQGIEQKFDVRLVKELGDELNQIFETSEQIIRQTDEADPQPQQYDIQIKRPPLKENNLTERGRLKQDFPQSLKILSKSRNYHKEIWKQQNNSLFYEDATKEINEENNNLSAVSIYNNASVNVQENRLSSLIEKNEQISFSGDLTQFDTIPEIPAEESQKKQISQRETTLKKIS